MDLSDDGTIVSAARCGSALERYGVGKGSQIDLQALSVAGRVEALWPKANAIVALPFAGVPQKLEFRAIPLEPDPVMTWLLYMRIVALALCLIVAGLLVALRPSIMSWAFYVFVAFSAPSAAAHPVLATWNPRLAIAGVMIWQVLLMLAAVAFLTFVLRFPRDVASGRLANVELALAPLFVCAAFVAMMPSAMFFIAGRSAHGWTVASEIALAMIFAIGLATLAIKYAFADGADRPKLAVVLWCLLVGFTGFIADALLGAFGFPAWLARLFGLLTVVVPLGVAYATLRHRVIDVRIVISHTLAYTAVVASVVVVFSTAEYLLGAFFHRDATSFIARFTLFAAGVATPVILFFVHEPVMRVIERWMFRSRLAQEQRMALLAPVLADAVSAKELAEALSVEVAGAMRLVSAAAFLRGSDGLFRRIDSVGWRGDELLEAGDGDALVKAVHAMHRLSHLKHAITDTSNAPADDRRPEVALPLVLRGKLLGFALYGAHANGAALDHQERKLLNELATPAAAAFDHIESIALRARNRRLEDENARLRGRAGAIAATILVACCLLPSIGSATEVTAPNLSRVPQIERTGDDYQDRATHFVGKPESHWTALQAGSTQLVIGVLDARAPIHGNSFDVLIFNRSNGLIGTLPIPRRPLFTIYRAFLDVRYSVDRDAPNTPCCRGDYIDLFVSIANGRAAVVSSAYGPPIGGGGSSPSESGPGLQQTSAGSNSPVLAVGLPEVRRLAFDESGTLWAADLHTIVAVDADARSVMMRHQFAPQCHIFDMVPLHDGSAVALTCGEIDIVSTKGTVLRISDAPPTARLVGGRGALWVLEPSQVCRLVPQRSCTTLDGASVGAIDEGGALVVAQPRGESTAILRIAPDADAPAPVTTVPWRVGWIAWRDAPILIPADAVQAYALRADGTAAPICTFAGPVQALSAGGYAGVVAAFAGGELVSVDASGCNRLEPFPALHPNAFAFSNTLLAVGYASSDIVFSAVPASR